MSRGRVRRVSAHRLESVTVRKRKRDGWGSYYTTSVTARHKRCGCLERVCAAAGLTVARFLGRGMYAAAWLLANGRVLKITDEEEAVALAQRLQGLQAAGRAMRFVRTFEVHDAGRCDLTGHRVWALVQERLAPYTTYQRNEGRVVHGPEREWPNSAEDAAWRAPPSLRIPNPAEYDDIAASMRDAGVSYMSDLHDENVMLRGAALVISDLGLYEVARADPDKPRSPALWRPKPTTPPFPRLRAFLAASCKRDCKGAGSGPVPPT